MESHLKELLTYLDAQSGSLTSQTNLFASQLPELPIDCVSLNDGVPMPPVETMNKTGLAVIERPAVQVITRWSDYSGGYAIAHDCWRILNAISNQTIDGTFYQRVEAVQSPFLLERDSNNRPIFVCNFNIMREVS